MTAASLQRTNTTERSQLAVEIRGLSKSFGRTKGRAVKSGTLEELRHLMRTTVTVRTREDSQALQGIPYVHDFTYEDGVARFSVDRADLDFTMDHLTELGIVELTVTPASLEELFLREYQGADR